MRVIFLLLALLVPSVSYGEVKSKYLIGCSKGCRGDKGFKGSKSSKGLTSTTSTTSKTSLSWTAFGQLVGKVDNLLIIRTKDGKYLLKKDFR